MTREFTTSSMQLMAASGSDSSINKSQAARLWEQPWFAPAVLALLSLLVVLSRLHTFHEPLERDLTSYGIMAELFLQGKQLYIDLGDQKPPLYLLTIAGAHWLFGHGPAPFFAVNVLASLTTLFGVFAATRFANFSIPIALLAAGFWTLVSGDLWLQANQPNSEVFMNALLIWGFAFCVRNLNVNVNDEGEWRLGLALAAGACFALATLYKHIVVIAGVAIPLSMVIVSWPDRAARTRAIKQVAVVGVVGLSAWLSLLLFLKIQGGLSVFLDIQLRFNPQYAGNMGTNLLLAMTPRLLLPWIMAATFSLVATSLVGATFGLLRRSGVWGLWIAYAIATLVHVALPGRFFPHYYQLWLPVLCVGGAWGIAELQLRFSRPLLSVVVATIVAFQIMAVELPLYAHSADEWSQLKLRWLHPREQRYGDVFTETVKLARNLDTILEPGEQFYEWGHETGLFYYSQRPPPTRVFELWGVSSGPLRQELTNQTLSQLEETKPEIFVLNKRFGDLNRPHHAILTYAAKHYRLYPEQPSAKYFRLYMRRGGALEARLATPTTAPQDSLDLNNRLE